MRKLVKPISMILTIAYLLLIPFTSFAATGNPSSTGDTALLNKWKGLDLLEQSVGSSELYQPIQKIDFIMFINNILKSSKKADIGFNDVPKDSWYGVEIAKAVASGYIINQTKTNFTPFSTISRLDSAIMVSKVFGLELGDEKLLNKITDAEKLDKDQLKAFGAVIEKGYLSEISSGRYAPLGVLKLIDAIKMLDKCIGLVIAKSGTVTRDVTGNMIINASSVILKDMEITGDLIIGEGVSDGTVRLENVSVRGKMVIRGGGPNSVIIKNSRIAEDLVVEKFAGNVNVVAQGTTTIQQTKLKSGGKLAESGLTSGKGFVNVTAEQAVVVNQIANLEGEFNIIQMDSSNINVKLNGKAESVKILKDTIAYFSLVSGNAKTISTAASKSTIELIGGTVDMLNVEAGAKGNKIEINGVTTVSKMNISDTTAINFDKGTVETLTFNPPSGGSYLITKKEAYIKNIVANAASTISGLGKIDYAYVYANNVNMDVRPISFYVANGVASNINGTIVDPTKSTVSFTVADKINVQEGETESLNVSGLNPANTTLAYISSDNSIATVSEKGIITGVSTGTTKIHVTGQYPSYNTKVADIDVVVSSNNVTATGSLQVSPPSGEAGTRNDFEIKYTAGDNMSNGTVVIKLPAGFSVFETDTVNIDGSGEKGLEVSQRPNIQTLSFTNLNLKQDTGTIVIKLKNRIVPPGNKYEFIAISDADGTGPKLPTSGDEKAVFTSAKLKTLLIDYNYSKPEHGTTGGTTKIAKLSAIGFTGSTKWLINVQSGAFTSAPSFDDSLTGANYIEYKQGENITVAAGQYMRLAAVDGTDGQNKVKAYADIVIDGNWIRPNNAGELVLGSESIVPGIKANSVRIKGLDSISVTGADRWMVKVQNTAPPYVFINTKFVEAEAYTSGDDISVYAGQHILLAAVGENDSIKAYKDIVVTTNMPSVPAGTLILDNNFKQPTFGAGVGTIKIEELNKGSFDIDKWMVVTLGKEAAIPALGVSTTEFQKYTEGKTFSEYNNTTNPDISVLEGQHLMLIGVKVEDTTNTIKAYVDLTIDGTVIRQADALQIPDVNFAVPVMGLTAGTTKLPSLNFSTPIADAKKYMVKVQNEVFAVPQMNSIQSGAVDCTQNQDIKISSKQHLVLLATDANGRIKAYKDIVVNNTDGSQIRPGDALKLLIPNDYSLPTVGSTVGSTKIMLSSSAIPVDPITKLPLFKEWRYKIQNVPFETPYEGSKILDTTYYEAGSDIPIAVGQNILIIAVDASDRTLAYTQEAISPTQIKQPNASKLIASGEVAADQSYNYSDPVPGQAGGTTRINTLNTMGIQGATKWLYKISSAAAAIPEYEYNSIVSGLQPYMEGASIEITSGQYFVLFAVDDYNRTKAFKNILIDGTQIRTPNATLLVSQTNYSTPTVGSAEGETMITSLSFVGLEGQNDTWKWRYAVGVNMFSAPIKDSDVSALGFTTSDFGVNTSIEIEPNQYILLLAVDGTAIKGYANIYVQQSSIRPYNAGPIATTSYSLVKGSSEGTTRFDHLDLIGISDAKNWMIKVQKDTFDIPAKDFAVTGATLYNLKSDIKISVGWHILLLATDSLGRVKAYADITVGEGQIQAPFAMLLSEPTNFTAPEPGTTAGTVKITLNDTDIPKASGETIVWKYKKGTQEFAVPHLDDVVGTEYYQYPSTATDGSKYDIPVQAGNVVLVVATINNEIKAYRQFIIKAEQIKPANATELIAGTNYNAPVAGSAPGTTKIDGLSFIGLPADVIKWVVKAVDVAQPLILNSIFTYPINYSNGADISVNMNQFVVLAAVDKDGRVKAYKNIQITEATQLNPPTAKPLDPVTNYSIPEYGSAQGTTSIKVSLNGINNSVGFIAKVVVAPVNIISGQTITVGTGTDSDYNDFRSYTTRADIAVSPNKYVLLVAVDSGNKVLAYANIQVPEGSIRPGNAIELKPLDNYSTLQPGAGVGTTKFTALDFVGIPVDSGSKWVIKVLDNALTQAPLINSSVESATAYTVQSDIAVKEGQYVALYAVDSTNRVKGYACILVEAANVRGVAPQLQINSSPVPGTLLNTTIIGATSVTMPKDTILKYIVQDSAAGTILKDTLLTDLTTYKFDVDNITAVEGQHLILVATDINGYVKAYKDILVTANMLKNVLVTLSGTIITSPTGESNIVSGGRTITVTLDIAEWQDDILTNSIKRNMLYEGFVAAIDEQAQWGKVIAALKFEGATAASMSSNKKAITITLSEASGYNITKSQEISLIVKPELIKNAVKPAVSLNTITIAADVLVQLDGTAITQGLGEGDILAGGRTIIINLTNGEFALDVASNKLKRDAIFDGFKASYNTTEWAKVIAALKNACDNATTDLAIIRNTSRKITITLPAVTGYNIAMNETINLTVPYMTVAESTEHNILVGAIRDVTVPTQLTIFANASAELTGTLLTETISEGNIVTGSKTIEITLTDGQWVTDIDTNSTKRNALFAGFVATTENSEWTKVVSALQAAGQTAIEIINSNTVKITLPAVLTYNIASNQYIGLNIPAACIIGAKASLIAKQTIIVERVAGATLSGTAVGSTITETDINLGSKTVIITLNGANWISDIATNASVKAKLFEGFVADVDQVQWTKVVDALKAGLGSVTKTATNTITITLPTVMGYNIATAKQNISVTIPISAVIGSSFDIPASNTITINSTPPTAAKIIEVKAETKTYKLGDVVNIDVKFDNAVDVTGVPFINLETGNIDRNAYYTTGSGINILTFAYKVEEDDASQKLDYKTVDSLILQGAAILTNGSSVKAVTTLPAPGSSSSLSTSNIYVDAVAPKLATGYPQKSTITELTADILVKVNEKATIYYVTMLNDINNNPTVTDVITGGTNAAEGIVPSPMMGRLSIVENTEGKLPITGLTAFTDYTVYMVMVDSLGNTSSSISSFNFKTLDTTQPEFAINYPVQSTTKYDNKIDILIKTNDTGMAYMVALPAGSIAPTSAQVKGFQNGSGGPVSTNLRAKASITKDSEITLSVTGLTVSTTYDIYVVCEDASLNVIQTPKRVSATTSQLSLDNVDVDLAKKILTGTTIQMEYSFDEMLWNKCTATNTSITFDDNAEILTIYIREAINITNTKLLLPIRESADIIVKSSISYDIAAKTITNASTINLQYRIDGGAWGALMASGIAANVDFKQGLLEVRTAATALTATEKSKLPSIPVLIDNIAVPMPAPNLAYSDDDNIIQGLDGTYEYRIDAGLWKTGAVDGTFAGTKAVEVRQKATKDKLPSVGQVIQFTAGTIKVVAAPAAATEKLFVSSVTITFEENTNKIALTAQNLRDWFLVGTWNTTSGEMVDQHYWGEDADISAEWNTAGNVLTIKYKAMNTATTVKINDEVRIDAAAGIKNAAGTSASYTSKGTLTGSFHTVPAIVSIKAENSGNNIGFGVGDSIVITFNQATNKKAITAADIDTLLKITNPTNSTLTKTWNITKDSAIVWNAEGTKLTITYDAASVAAVLAAPTTALKLSDKITVSASWGLTDADKTTEVCNSSSFISGSFTSIPIITSVVIADGKDSLGNSVVGINKGDTITITFDQATNKKAITAAQLIYYFKLLAVDGKTAHSWGVQANTDITWNAAGTALIIKLSSTAGVTLVANDTLTLSSSAGIKAADGGTLAVGSTAVGSIKVITGGY